MTQRLVVIGAGMASGRMIEHLLDGAPEGWDITLFNAEPRGNYNRLMLSPVLSGEKTYDEIVTHDGGFYAARGIACRFGETVTRIDRARKVVVSAGGETPYDRLVIATGSAPFIIPVAGRDLPGVVTYRDLEDTNALIAASAPGAKAVVIGGGLLGLEAAAGMAARGAAFEASAREGTPALPFRSAWAVLSAAGIYGAIGREVAARGEHAWDHRVTTSGWQKLAFIAKAAREATQRERLYPRTPRDPELWTRPR